MRYVFLPEAAYIEEVLNAHHYATSTKDVRLLRRSFTPDGFFVGTDDAEFWPVDQYVQFLEATESGWSMSVVEQHLYYISEGLDDIVMFFEVIKHEDLGLMRGSGVVWKGDDESWKIAQYVLSFSVPNTVVDGTNFLKPLAAGFNKKTISCK